MKDPEGSKTEVLRFRIEQSEKKRFEAFAELNGLSISQFLRLAAKTYIKAKKQQL
jgi:antitoxin component of RelBE/YafQ-DinJ toxin-antitoxin module